jgi:hypothetical protein
VSYQSAPQRVTSPGTNWQVDRLNVSKREQGSRRSNDLRTATAVQQGYCPVRRVGADGWHGRVPRAGSGRVQVARQGGELRGTKRRDELEEARRRQGRSKA